MTGGSFFDLNWVRRRFLSYDARQTSAQIFRQNAILQSAGMCECDSSEIDGSRSSDGDQNPDEQRDEQAKERRSLQGQRDINLMELKVHKGLVLKWLNTVNDRESEDENRSRHSAQHDKGDIDRTVKTLTRTALIAFREVLHVVNAHVRADAGNVVSPTRKYVSYYWISACCHRHRWCLLNFL